MLVRADAADDVWTWRAVRAAHGNWRHKLELAANPAHRSAQRSGLVQYALAKRGSDVRPG